MTRIAMSTLSYWRWPSRDNGVLRVLPRTSSAPGVGVHTIIRLLVG